MDLDRSKSRRKSKQTPKGRSNYQTEPQPERKQDATKAVPLS